jgi:hypothetical protein
VGEENKARKAKSAAQRSALSATNAKNKIAELEKKLDVSEAEVSTEVRACAAFPSDVVCVFILYVCVYLHNHHPSHLITVTSACFPHQKKRLTKEREAAVATLMQVKATSAHHIELLTHELDTFQQAVIELEAKYVHSLHVLLYTYVLI